MGAARRRAAVNAVVPFLAVFSRGAARTRLELTRLVFSTVVVALFLLVVVVGVLVPWTSSGSVPVVVWLLLAAGLVGLVGAAWARGRPVACRAGAELARAYRERVLGGVAFGEAPAVLGFVAALQADAAWPYLVGLALSLIALAVIAPTDGDVERKDAQLRASGCAQSLRQALLAAPDDT